MKSGKGGCAEAFNFGVLLIHSSLDGFCNLVLAQEGNIPCHLCPLWLTTPRNHIAFGIRVSICSWGTWSQMEMGLPSRACGLAEDCCGKDTKFI